MGANGVSSISVLVEFESDDTGAAVGGVQQFIDDCSPDPITSDTEMELRIGLSITILSNKFTLPLPAIPFDVPCAVILDPDGVSLGDSATGEIDGSEYC